MKRLAGIGLISLIGVFMIYGIFKFGFFNVMVPASFASLIGFVVLGGIHLMRYTSKKEFK